MKDCILPDAGYPEMLVNIKNIPGLDYVREERRRPARRRAHPAGRPGRQTRLVQRQVPGAGRSRPQDGLSPHPGDGHRRRQHLPEQPLLVLLGAGQPLRLPAQGRQGLLRAHRRRAVSLHLRSGAGGVDRLLARPAPTASTSPPTWARSGRATPPPRPTILLRQNPLPAVTGRVCPHSCETDCARGEFDEAVSIREVERFLGDQILDDPGRLLPGAGADHRQAGGRHRLRPGRSLGGPLPAPGRPRGHRLRAHARGRRPAGLRHPALPSPPRSRCASRSRPSRARASSSARHRGRHGEVRGIAEGLRRGVRRPPAPGRRPQPASPASSACTSGTDFLRSQKPTPRRWPARPWCHRRRQHRHRRGPLAAAAGRQAGDLLPPHQGRDARPRRRVREGGGRGRQVRVPHPAGGGRGGERRGGAHLLPHGTRRPRRERPAPPGQGGRLRVRRAVRRGHQGHRGEAGLLLPAAPDSWTRRAGSRSTRPAMRWARGGRLRRRRLRHRARRRSPKPPTPGATRPSPSTATSWARARPPGEARTAASRPVCTIGEDFSGSCLRA